MKAAGCLIEEKRASHPSFLGTRFWMGSKYQLSSRCLANALLRMAENLNFQDGPLYSDKKVITDISLCTDTFGEFLCQASCKHYYPILIWVSSFDQNSLDKIQVGL